MDFNNMDNFIEQLRLLSRENSILIKEINHRPLSGGYLGHITLHGIKKNLEIKICIDLDFLEERDGITLSINSIDKSSNIIKEIQNTVNQMKNNYYIPYSKNWY